jgi:hypothetical protein
MKHIAETLFGIRKPELICIFSFLLIFLTISLALAQQRTISDSIPFKINAFREKVNISMSGGSEKTSYRASINYHNGNGILKMNKI